MERMNTYSVLVKEKKHKSIGKTFEHIFYFGEGKKTQINWQNLV